MATFDRLLALASLLPCFVAGCATQPPAAAQSPSVSAAPPQPASSQSPPACELYCETPEMVPRAAPGPDYTQEEVDNANAVLGAMRNELLRCYTKRLAVHPDAHAVITLDVLIGDDGRVARVDAAGGDVLGATTLGCITRRIEGGVFEPPHGGGKLRVRVPFTLRRVAPGDDST